MTFQLKDFDLYGFDLDHTLCQYKLDELFSYQHCFMTTFLSNIHGFESIDIGMSSGDIDFMSRGLMIDTERGIILKVNEDGVIIKANLGFHQMTETEISRYYGNKHTWEICETIAKRPLYIRSKKAMKKVMFISDFTTMVMSLVFSKAVDSTNPRKTKASNVWPNVLKSVVNMYKEGSDWAKHFSHNIEHFTYRTDKCVINWITQLKSRAKTALITSSDISSASLVAERALGENWTSLFDFIIFGANKPCFFTETSSFFSIQDLKPSQKTAFTLSGQYFGGCYSDVLNVLKERIGRHPRTLYFGDSPINDLTGPTESIGIIEEIGAEHLVPHKENHMNYLTSKHWGSLFYENNVPTLFGKIIMSSKYCAPSLSFIASKPCNFNFVPFWSPKE